MLYGLQYFDMFFFYDRSIINDHFSFVRIYLYTYVCTYILTYVRTVNSNYSTTIQKQHVLHIRCHFKASKLEFKVMQLSLLSSPCCTILLQLLIGRAVAIECEVVRFTVICRRGEAQCRGVWGHAPMKI